MQRSCEGLAEGVKEKDLQVDHHLKDNANLRDKVEDLSVSVSVK